MQDSQRTILDVERKCEMLVRCYAELKEYFARTCECVRTELENGPEQVQAADRLRQAKAVAALTNATKAYDDAAQLCRKETADLQNNLKE